MRKQVLSTLLPLLVLGILGPACGTLQGADQDKKDALEQQVIGTWKMVSAKFGDRQIDMATFGVTLKHITPTSFVWVSYDSQTKVVSRAAGGAYTLKGDQYEELPQYGFGPDFEVIRDRTQSFRVKIEGDKLYQSGALSNGLKIEEVWERCKKP